MAHTILELLYKVLLTYLYNEELTGITEQIRLTHWVFAATVSFLVIRPKAGYTGTVDQRGIYCQKYKPNY